MTHKVEDWRDRLNHADRVWKKHGYNDQADWEKSVRRNADAYRGKHWGREDMDDPDSEFMVDNIFYSTINVLMSSLFARYPIVDVLSERPASKDNANIFERLLTHNVQSPKLQMKREWNKVLFDALLYNFGFLRHGFTPSEEKFRKGKLIDSYDPARPDFPWVRRIPPWDMRVDPLAESFHSNGDARWCAFRSLHYMDEIKNSPTFKARQDLKPTRSINIEKLSGRERNEFRQSPDEPELVEVWTIYDKMSREMFAISPGSDKFLIDPKEWPIPWETLPYNMLQFNPMTDDPFGTTYADQILPLQGQLNSALTIANQIALTLRRVVLLQEDSMDPSEVEKLSQLDRVEFITTRTDPRAAMQELQIAGFPAELIQYIAFLIDQIRQIIGVSELERASRINVQTASEVNQVAAGSQANRGRNQGPWEDFLSESIAAYALGLQKVITRTFTIPIVGEEDADQLFTEGQLNPFETIAPESIRGEFLIMIRPGSTLPRDPNSEIRLETAMNEALGALPAQELVNWPQRAIATVRAFNKKPNRDLTPLAVQNEQQRIANAQGLAGGEPQQPSQGINPQIVSLLAEDSNRRLQ